MSPDKNTTIEKSILNSECIQDSNKSEHIEPVFKPAE